MFKFIRNALAPVALFCCVIIAASADAYWTNASRKASWPQTIVTVLQAQHLGDVAAEWRGTPNNFPDPRGSISYTVDGQTYTWRGRGREIGLTAMTPGDQIKLYYNPRNPNEINALVLLGAATGNLILAAACTFLGLYIWFFWVRRSFRDSGPGGLNGQPRGSSASRAGEGPDQERFGSERRSPAVPYTEGDVGLARARAPEPTFGASHAAFDSGSGVIGKLAPSAPSGQGRRATFGKRSASH